MNKIFQMFSKNKTMTAIKNRPLEQVIVDIEKADGYLILWSKLEGDKLIHGHFSSNFKKNDMFPALDEYAKLLEREIK